jgi:2-oxoglutarate ferredoxin oxidoreductase subunit alpha
MNWASANLTNDQPYRVSRMTGFNEGTLLVDGNTASRLGAVFGGFTFVAWYPITPSSSLAESMITYAAKLRRDPETQQATYAIVQAEDELAAIGMVLGAGWAGARAMTATSGPGISLMAEFVGYGYFAEIPAVIWDVQRMGPSTGLPTRTSQGDICCPRTRWATATGAIPCCFRLTRPSASRWPARPSTWPNGCRRRSLSSATWTLA